jgi:hypothetical protein
LQIRCCDGGDDMVEDIFDSGVLQRLKVLDLRHGRVTDDGAKMLAACPELKGIEVDLVNNRLSPIGVAAVARAAARARTEPQQKRPYHTSSLFCGDTG